MFSDNGFMVAFFIYSLPYEEVLKLTFAAALDYSGLIPNVRSE